LPLSTWSFSAANVSSPGRAGRRDTETPLVPTVSSLIDIFSSFSLSVTARLPLKPRWAAVSVASISCGLMRAVTASRTTWPYFTSLM